MPSLTLDTYATDMANRYRAEIANIEQDAIGRKQEELEAEMDTFAAYNSAMEWFKALPACSHGCRIQGECPCCKDGFELGG